MSNKHNCRALNTTVELEGRIACPYCGKCCPEKDVVRGRCQSCGADHTEVAA